MGGVRGGIGQRGEFGERVDIGRRVRYVENEWGCRRKNGIWGGEVRMGKQMDVRGNGMQRMYVEFPFALTIY